MDASKWVRELAEELLAEFGERVVFVGLQGSRARGEAREGSDIDAVVLLDEVTADDLTRYRSIVGSMEFSELACGFVGSVPVLSAWPRHELFQFYNDTVPVLGSLPDVGPFTRDDALQAARIGASGIYHAACHAFVFEASATPEVLKPLFKGAFFVLQAVQFVRMGVYPRTKAELSELLDGDDALILKTGRNWDSRLPVDERETRSLVDLLIRWAESVMRYMPDDDDFEERFEPYLKPTEYIDFGDERVAAVAQSLNSLAPNRLNLIKTTYEYVRDRVSHSYDAQLHAPAAKASEVLEAGGSICWGKANLLAALLRANGVPSGISYQVLTKGDTPESGYMVHALNTVYVDDAHGWVRLDARGNKEGVDAQFSLDSGGLAYHIRPECGERDFNDNHADADPELMRLIAESDDILAVSSDAVLDRRIRSL